MPVEPPRSLNWVYDGRDGQTYDLLPFGAAAQKVTTNLIFDFLGLNNILPHGTWDHIGLLFGQKLRIK